MTGRDIIAVLHDVQVELMHDAHVEAQRINRDLAILKDKRDGSWDKFRDRLDLQRQVNDGSVQ